MGPEETAAATLEVELVRNGLAAIAEEMSITHVRAAYSPVVRDALDFSTALADGEGRVVAQGVSLALMLGAVPRFMSHLRAAAPDPRPGDLYLLNHPWQGGVHLPDFFFAKPVFIDGDDRPLGYTVLVSHMVDVGGSNPGGVSVAARSLWDEGLVLPLVRLVENGQVNEAILDIIGANSREPARVLGDTRAAIAALETGATQMLDFAARFGADRLRHGMGELLDRTERATRRAIAALPDGAGSARDHLDDDGKGSEPLLFACRVEKEGDRIRFDFTGTEPQVAAGINTTIADVVSVVAFATRAGLGEDIDVNDGFYRCLEYRAPEGSIVNATYPAALGARATSIYRAGDVALAALAELLPERIPANDGGPGVLYFSGMRDDGSNWILMDFVQAGWGANAGGDGVPGVSHPIANAANVPIEVVEQEYPVRVSAYRLVPDTAGPGEHAGAPAVEREYEVLADGTTVAMRIERSLHPPRGVAGGGDGTASAIWVSRAGGDWEPGPRKGVERLGRGDRVRLRLASGAGYGDPSARAAEAIERDLVDGLLTVEQAAAAYGHAAEQVAR